MLKKILTLSLVAVLLSVSVFAEELTPVVTDAGLSASSEVSENNAVIDEAAGLGGTVTLAVTSDAAYADAIVVTAVFDQATFLTASITDAALVLGENTKTITLPTAKTEANNSYNVKFFLWESKTTLEPLAQPIAVPVTPQEETETTHTIYATNPKIATWDANATKPTFTTHSRWNTGYGIGTNSYKNVAPILRFTLSEIGDNVTVTSAKLVTTLAEKTNMKSENFIIRACTGFMDIEPGEAISVNDIGSFAEATATVSGQKTVTKSTAAVGDKIEIDVTEYVQSLEAGGASADFLLAVTELTTATQNSHLKIYRTDATDEANRPVLVITTKAN